MAVVNKLFVGGLGPQTSSESMNEHFLQYGIADCMVMMDRSTGRSRGFGFVTFEDPESVNMVLVTPQVINGKAVECKVCLSKEQAPEALQPRSLGQGRGFQGSRRLGNLEQDFVPDAPDHGAFESQWTEPPLDQSQGPADGGHDAQLVVNKIFVGGLAPVTTNESMNAYFSQYGPCDCVVMMDRQTGRSRGFGFCTFETAEEAQFVMQSTPLIDGKAVECKLCEPKGVAPPSTVVRGRGPTAPAPAFRRFDDRSAPAALPQWSPRERQEHRPSRPTSRGFPAVGPAVSRPAPLAPTVPTGARIFVGGLPQSCREDSLDVFFSQFGQIVDCTVMMDQGSGRSRGFGYITFADARSVDNALANAGSNVVDGKWVEVKRCEAKGAVTGSPHAGMGGPSAVDRRGPAPHNPRQIAQQANQVAQLLQDPTLGLQSFLGPMLQQLQQVAAATKMGMAHGGGKGNRYRPF